MRRGLDYRLAGKTGTAQVVSIAEGEKYDSRHWKRKRDHALFVALLEAPGSRWRLSSRTARAVAGWRPVAGGHCYRVVPIKWRRFRVKSDE